MDDEKNKKSRLRKKAEDLLNNQINLRKDPSKVDDYIHELHVHQIELEIQNEELKEAQIKLEDSRHKYFDLYNFAPVGYFTLDINGIILDVNLAGSTLLGVERHNLNKRTFIQYVKPDQRNIFHHHIIKVLETRTKQTADLELLKMNSDSFYGHLETIKVQDENGDFQKFRVTITDITDLKNTEEALKESEERYRQIFVNNHATMLLIDPINGDIIDANPAATNFYGYTLDELVKMKISDINVSDDNLVLEEMQKAVSQEENHFVFKHILSNGDIRDVDVYSGLINHRGKNLLYSIVHDITVQKKAEIARRNTEELFRLIFDQSPFSSAITTLDYTPLKINDTFSNMLGYSKKELFSMKFPEYTHLDDLNEELELLNRITLGEIDNFVMEKKYIHKNGGIICANLFISAVKDQSNKLVNFLVIVEDITERKKMENLISQRTDKLANINKLLNVEIDDHEKAEIKLDNLIKN